MKIVPINLFQYKISPPILNVKYVNNLIENGIIKDFFIPGIAAQNPIFSQVNDLNEKIGILQTATKGIDTILNYIDILKKVNPNEEEVLNNLINEINKTIQNTTFNNLPVFNQTLKIADTDINLSIPILNINDINNIDKYEKILLKTKNNIVDTLKNISLNLTENTKFNPYKFENFQELLNSGELITAYKNNIINPYTLELLLS